MNGINTRFHSWDAMLRYIPFFSFKKILKGNELKNGFQGHSSDLCENFKFHMISVNDGIKNYHLENILEPHNFIVKSIFDT